MNALELLKRSHRDIEKLLRGMSIENVSERVVDELTTKLIAHSRAEEEIFYAALRVQSDQGRAMIEDAQGEHRRVDELLAELRDGDALDFVITELRDLVAGHVAVEESQIFAYAQHALSSTRLEELGRALELRMTELERSAQIESVGSDRRIVI